MLMFSIMFACVGINNLLMYTKYRYVTICHCMCVLSFKDYYCNNKQKKNVTVIVKVQQSTQTVKLNNSRIICWHIHHRNISRVLFVACMS